MDWDSAHRADFKAVLQRLIFETRPVKLFELKGTYTGAPAQLPSFTTRDLPADQDVTEWMDQDCRAPERAPENPFERERQSSGASLSDVGISRPNFVRLFNEFKMAKSFLHALQYGQSLYSFEHPEIGLDGYSFLSILAALLSYRLRADVEGFNIRTTPVLLKDKAMTVRHDVGSASTFVLLQGCTSDELTEELSRYVRTMQRYGGHPLLMVALFMDMSYRRLRQSYYDLRSDVILLFSNVFGRQSHNQKLEAFNETLSRASGKYESLLTLESELMALRLRLTRFIGTMQFVAHHTSAVDKRKEYMDYYGGRMTDRLQIFGNDLEYLQSKCTSQKESLQLLLSSMTSIVTLSEGKISRQISVASKRDSTIMMGIAVGTMLFLPLTAMASIFAMPFLPWNAQQGDSVNRRPLLIYLTLSLPLTAVSITLLVTWMWAVDYEAESSHVTLKPRAAKLLQIVTGCGGLRGGRTGGWSNKKKRKGSSQHVV